VEEGSGFATQSDLQHNLVQCCLKSGAGLSFQFYIGLYYLRHVFRINFDLNGLHTAYNNTFLVFAS
jgi:hypothetical protein